jgi:hypothetical protein
MRRFGLIPCEEVLAARDAALHGPTAATPQNFARSRARAEGEIQKIWQKPELH